eukprot:CAMPEP_0116889484 /NCGR_PEP_ID=MMETSP0467-20121206/4_1 /TAXON_ID=283647 /ORGANISM="Mesodinium pulex, Strain SPMC105" /LENGTH=72 /DNA_ID=CAMNT_0004556253 /DNA_START=3241 /DNA_END=3459 /DNA_ORIENTATION=+
MELAPECANSNGTEVSSESEVGCLCNSYVNSILMDVTGDFGTAYCTDSCPAGNYLCYGRFQSAGVTFCGTSD